MDQTRKPLIIRDLYILGIYQLLGGLWGLLLMGFYLYDSFDHSTISWVFLTLGVVLFSFSSVCGILCIKQERYALPLSRVNQVLQLITISGTNFGCRFVTGVAIFAGLNLEDGFGLSFSFDFTSLSFYVSDEVEDKIVMINLLALYLLFNFNVLIKENKINNEPTLDLENSNS